MPLNLSLYDNLLKEFYESPVRNTLNNEIPMFKLLEGSDKEWSGRRVVFPVKTSRNSGVGSRAENATLPTAGNQGHELAVVSATYHYGRIRLTGQTLAAGKNAFVTAMSSEMEGLVNDLKVDLGRQTWGDGTGRLGQIGADGASASALSVYNRFFEPGQPGARYISQNQIIDAGTAAAPTAEFSSQTVVSVNLSENPATDVDTVTISASALTVSQCDTFLFNRGAGGIEMMGLLGLVDQYTQANIWGSNAFAGATVQNISRATVSRWNAQVLANSGTARLIDPNLMQVAFDKIHIESGKDVNLIFGEHSVVRAFLDSVSADRRYASNKFDAGQSSLSYNGVAIERDRLAPYNTLFVGCKDELKMYTLLDFQWADEDGSILSRVDATDAYDAYMKTYRNIGIEGNPKALLMIRDIRTDL